MGKLYSEKNWRCHGNDRRREAKNKSNFFSYFFCLKQPLVRRRSPWQLEMKKNSKLGHEREQKEWKQREIVENERVDAISPFICFFLSKKKEKKHNFWLDGAYVVYYTILVDFDRFSYCKMLQNSNFFCETGLIIFQYKWKIYKMRLFFGFQTFSHLF